MGGYIFSRQSSVSSLQMGKWLQRESNARLGICLRQCVSSRGGRVGTEMRMAETEFWFFNHSLQFGERLDITPFSERETKCTTWRGLFHAYFPNVDPLVASARDRVNLRWCPPESLKIPWLVGNWPKERCWSTSCSNGVCCLPRSSVHVCGPNYLRVSLCIRSP